MRINKLVFFSLAAAVAWSAMGVACQAHFLWIKAVSENGQPQGLLFFNESPADESYHFPEKLAKVKLSGRAASGKPVTIETKGVDTENRVGLVGPIKDDAAVVLQTSQQYGIYGTALLVYHAKCVRAADAENFNAAGTSDELKLEIVPKLKGDEVELTVLWDGKPLAGADVQTFVGDKEAIEHKTGGDGKVTFKPEGNGLVGVLANTMEKDKPGDLDGKSYKGVMHYASLTFDVPGHSVAAKSDAKTDEKKGDGKSEDSAEAKPKGPSAIAPLPEGLASFGAVVNDGWLYVYGGHTGEEHEHSAANLSKHFRRIKLDDAAAQWEELPMETAVQGLPLVAHGGKVYRVGGLDIRNATTKDKEDLHSTAEFAEFDPVTKKWTALKPLPAARSSHNAAVIGDKLFVVGGWRLDGKSPGTWEPDALVFDFTKPEQGWEKLPLPTFKRRALGAGVWNGKLVALGGMDEKNKVSMQVDWFDPKSNEWKKGPSLPGAGMAGFGVSAWNLDGKLYVCGFRGVLYRLNDTGSAWEEAGHLETPRFFHQLVPAPHGELMAVGGASMDGHLATTERIKLGAHETAKKDGKEQSL